MAQVCIIDRDVGTRAASRRALEGAGHLHTTTSQLPVPPIFHDRATGLSLPVLIKPFDEATPRQAQRPHPSKAPAYAPACGERGTGANPRGEPEWTRQKDA